MNFKGTSGMRRVLPVWKFCLKFKFVFEKYPKVKSVKSRGTSGKGSILLNFHSNRGILILDMAFLKYSGHPNFVPRIRDYIWFWDFLVQDIDFLNLKIAFVVDFSCSFPASVTIQSEQVAISTQTDSSDPGNLLYVKNYY